ncbi:venom metalloproteinase antarease-like TtrivMP_A isoform X1 [Rhipicephalus sanguineus]|uniref:venom metalloproteinase antarease-like TtrivMP_A isoform X1 n=1 Tax=Rhipicephalus sanguineus TaxID=34632 RepID=UPI0018951348|nr:venom metalloproteinase antarease-like TtrivMP_A isoform X1 [Rhipicephalus sanguineus]
MSLKRYFLVQIFYRGPTNCFPEMLERRSANGAKVLKIADLTLNLEKSSILSKNFLLRTYEDKVMKHTYHDGEILEQDLYHDINHLASVMVSDDRGLQVEGVLGPNLGIKPLMDERSVDGRTAHVLYELSDDTSPNGANIGVQWNSQVSSGRNISERNDKADGGNAEARPELLVAVDSTFRSKFSSVLTIMRYLIICINSVNVRYMTVRGIKIRLLLQAIEIFDVYTEEFLYRVDELLAGYRTLETFQEYVERNPHKYDVYDAVYLITGLNMAQYNGYHWDLELQGIAYVAGACSNRKVGIGEDRVGTFLGVRITAHEIAHLMGCPHDGQFFQSYSSVDCPWNHGYIMSYKIQDSNSMKFSSCCQNNIWRFIHYGSGSCLLQLRSKRTIKKKNFTAELPGRLVKDLCKASYPEVSETYLIENEGRRECQGRCHMPEHIWRLGYKVAIFPDNTRCSEGKKPKICINGQCTEKKPRYSSYRPYK